MGTKRCCCTGTCTIFQDPFDRADATDLGASWDSGPWDIVSNRAETTTSGNAYCLIPHSRPHESMCVSIDTIDEVDFNKYRLIVNRVDNDNYHWAEFYIDGALASTITLGVRISGVETVLKSEIIVSLVGTARTFYAYIAKNEFCGFVSFSTLSLVSCDPTLIARGYYCGFGATMSTTSPPPPITCDNFVFQQHAETRDDCPSCLCQCDGKYVPPCLSAHLEGSGERMEGLSCDITVQWDRANNYWYGTGTCCDVEWVLKIDCGADPGDWTTWGLSVLNVSLNCTVTNGSDAIRYPVSGSCMPFQLEFGPYAVTAGDLACVCNGVTSPAEGHWTAVVTLCPSNDPAVLGSAMMRPLIMRSGIPRFRLL